MSFFPLVSPAKVGVAVLLCGTALAGAARAAPTVDAPIQFAQTIVPPAVAPPTTTSPMPVTGGATKPESVEERIASLHTALNITPKEEPDWSAVAKAMRDNAATMQKLAADKHAQSPDSATAVDDLKTYEKFAKAHVAGLKSLTSSFEKLYNTMPDAQKKVADQVFQSFGRHDGGAAHS
jgi:protein CpxP